MTMYSQTSLIRVFLIRKYLTIRTHFLVTSPTVSYLKWFSNLYTFHNPKLYRRAPSYPDTRSLTVSIFFYSSSPFMGNFSISEFPLTEKIIFGLILFFGTVGSAKRCSSSPPTSVYSFFLSYVTITLTKYYFCWNENILFEHIIWGTINLNLLLGVLSWSEARNLPRRFALKEPRNSPVVPSL